MRLRGMALAWLVVAALGGAAGAQPKDDQERAKAHYLKARAHHEHGEYQRAAAEYLHAFALFPDPELLFNVGQVYRLAGDQELAVAYYRRYLDLDPHGRAAPEARRHLEALGAARPAGSAATAPDAAADRGTPTATSATVAATPARATPSDDRRGRWLRWGGLATGGAGLFCVGLAIYFGVEARGISAELSRVDRWTAERLDRFDDGERAEALAVGFSVAGGALLVGGGVLYWLGWRGQEEPAVEVTAGLGPSGEVGLAAGGRF